MKTTDKQSTTGVTLMFVAVVVFFGVFAAKAGVSAMLVMGAGAVVFAFLQTMLTASNIAQYAEAARSGPSGAVSRSGRQDEGMTVGERQVFLEVHGFFKL